MNALVQRLKELAGFRAGSLREAEGLDIDDERPVPGVFSAKVLPAIMSLAMVAIATIALFAANDAPKKYALNNGSDWSLGTPTSFWGQHGVHDAQADLDGNIWFSVNVPNPYASLGRVDAKTGDVKFFRVDGMHGLAANGHGATRDAQGHLWFNTAPAEEKGPGRLIEFGTTDQIFGSPAQPATEAYVSGRVG